MELWVRSQDKTILSKSENIFLDDLDETEIRTKDFIIGQYKSKERALEVLDDIQRYINNGCKKFIDTGVYYTSKYEYRVYEMPQE